ncbi:MAG: hypothetical protein K9G11_00840 [Rickettsiaceae bacterium]|nr:hypothetical protein [Rickettsiaceae bacterium]
MKNNDDKDVILPVPKIQDKEPQEKEKIIENLAAKSFAQEIENDKLKSAVYINRAKEAAKELREGDPILKQEEAAIGVYKRALIAIGAGGLDIHSKDGTKSAANNNLPVSSYLSHGARVMIEIPANSGDSFANWLTSGNPRENGMSRNQSQQGAIDKDKKIVYNRSAATHDVSITKGKDGQYALKEKKGLGIGVKDFLSNKILNTKTNHFGVDLALNAEYNGKDSEGKLVAKPDGDHGHLYIHYIKPTQDKPGSMLIGIEGGSPASSKHSKTGASDSISAVDSSKFDDLAVKKQIATEEEYKDTIVPKKYGGMIVKLDQDKLKDIVQMKDTEMNHELAYVTPAKTPEEFKNNLKNKKYHETPVFQKSKDSELSIPKPSKPSILKKIAHWAVRIVTVNMIKPFNKELKAYKEELKAYEAYEAQNNVRKTDDDRKKQNKKAQSAEKTVVFSNTQTLDQLPTKSQTKELTNKLVESIVEKAKAAESSGVNNSSPVFMSKEMMDTIKQGQGNAKGA